MPGTATAQSRGSYRGQEQWERYRLAQNTRASTWPGFATLIGRCEGKRQPAAADWPAAAPPISVHRRTRSRCRLRLFVAVRSLSTQAVGLDVIPGSLIPMSHLKDQP